MADEKRPDSELLFTVRPALGEEDARLYDDAARRVAAQVFEALRPPADAAQAVGRLVAQMCAADFRVAPVNVEAIESAVAHAARVVGGCTALIASAVLGFVTVAEDVSRALEEMPDDEREELRQAIEDAPLEEVDVNASGLM